MRTEASLSGSLRWAVSVLTVIPWGRPVLLTILTIAGRWSILLTILRVAARCAALLLVIIALALRRPILLLTILGGRSILLVIALGWSRRTISVGRGTIIARTIGGRRRWACGSPKSKGQ